MSQDCKSITQQVTSLEKNRSRLQEQLKTSRDKAVIVEQINDINNEINQIKKANPNCFNMVEPPRIISRRTTFNPVTHGFMFPNAFINSNVYFAGFGPYETLGRCGGMAYASLDYYFAGRPIPKLNPIEYQGGIVPPDGHPLADYIYKRLIDSFGKGSSHKYITLSGVSDHETMVAKGLTKWSKEDEFPKIKTQIDRGIPVVLGLIYARNMLDSGQNHQVVAYGYSHDNNGHMEVYIYDNNHPLKESILASDTSNPHFNQHIVGGQPNVKIWRGFFVHDYDKQIPPQLDAASVNGPFYVNRKLVITPLTAKQGDRIEIRSTGIVDFGGAVLGIGAPKLNADGDSQKTPTNYPAPNLRKNSLIVKIGSTWYQGGTNKSFGASTAGTIQLFVNDNDPNNNTGAWKVYVNVKTQISNDWKAPWVRSLYKDLLGRPPENDFVVQAQVNGLNSGRPPRDVVTQFLTSEEYCYGYGYWLYKHFLDREPEPGAREGRGRQLMQGTSMQSLIFDFCESPEFKMKHPVPKEFVRYLYYKILKRGQDPEKADSQGFQFHISRINSGVSTATTIRGFTGALEFAYLMANEFFVRFLRRPHEPNPNSGHVKRITSGIPLQEVMKDILCSEEYIQGSIGRA